MGSLKFEFEERSSGGALGDYESLEAGQVLDDCNVGPLVSAGHVAFNLVRDHGG